MLLFISFIIMIIICYLFIDVLCFYQVKNRHFPFFLMYIYIYSRSKFKPRTYKVGGGGVAIPTQHLAVSLSFARILRQD